MTRRAPAFVAFAATAVAAGCGGSGDGEGAAAGGGCATAKTELVATISERDRLFVDLQLENATKACEDDLGTGGSTKQCTAARADLEAAAAAETPPADLEPRVHDAVETCVGTKITSTIPAP